MPGIREEDFFKKYINFTLFTPKTPLLGGGGHEIYNSFLLTLQMLHTGTKFS